MKKDRNCTGCLACVNICPRNCISIISNKEGFYRPAINYNDCIKCGLCDKVCKNTTYNYLNFPKKGYAFSNQNNIVLKHSSSGGFFSKIAEYILSKNGVVYGAIISKDGLVEHSRIDNLNNIIKMMGSKYVQSYIGYIYKSVMKDLIDNRLVLFTGTPCQIAGLNSFLNKKYDNLILVDVICHGVPSPLLWKLHFERIKNDLCEDIESISFRDKRKGISSYGLSIKTKTKEYYNPNGNDEYLIAFNNNYSLQKSCYKCDFKKIKCHSDITIGDLWNKKSISNHINTERDYTFVIINSNKAFDFLNEAKIKDSLYEVNMMSELKINYCRLYSAYKPMFRNSIINKYLNGKLNNNKKSHEIVLKKIIRKVVLSRKIKELSKGES